MPLVFQCLGRMQCFYFYIFRDLSLYALVDSLFAIGIGLSESGDTYVLSFCLFKKHLGPFFKAILVMDVLGFEAVLF